MGWGVTGGLGRLIFRSPLRAWMDLMPRAVPSQKRARVGAKGNQSRTPAPHEKDNFKDAHASAFVTPSFVTDIHVVAKFTSQNDRECRRQATLHEKCRNTSKPPHDVPKQIQAAC